MQKSRYIWKSFIPNFMIHMILTYNNVSLILRLQMDWIKVSYLKNSQKIKLHKGPQGKVPKVPKLLFWIEKRQCEFLVSSACLSRRVLCIIQIATAFFKNSSIFQIRTHRRGDHIKMNFDSFQIQKTMLQTDRAGKADEKME